MKESISRSFYWLAAVCVLYIATTFVDFYFTLPYWHPELSWEKSLYIVVIMAACAAIANLARKTKGKAALFVSGAISLAIAAYGMHKFILSLNRTTGEPSKLKPPPVGFELTLLLISLFPISVWIYYRVRNRKREKIAR